MRPDENAAAAQHTHTTFLSHSSGRTDGSRREREVGEGGGGGGGKGQARLGNGEGGEGEQGHGGVGWW